MGDRLTQPVGQREPRSIQPTGASVRRGVFVYHRHTAGATVTERLHVRECPDPAAVRLYLEKLLDRPVRWEADDQ